MRYVFVFLLMFCAQSYAESDTSTQPESMLLALMADAEEEKYEYFVKTSVDTDYRVSSYRAYIYFSESHELIRVHDQFVKTKARVVNFSFESRYLEQAYLVLEIKYGPNFLYDTNATGICVVPFESTSVMERIPCNALSTAQYLIASAMHNASPNEIINEVATKQYLTLNKLPNRKFWQDYLALHQLVLAHLAEIEDYQLAHQGNYLEVAYQLMKSMLENVRKYRRLRVRNRDEGALSIDPTMVNFAYRLFMSLDGLLKRNISLLPKVEESPTFVQDFFSGRIVFSLLTEEAAVVSGLIQNNSTIEFTYWPWFENVRLTFDEQPPLVTTETTHTIPPGSTRVDVTALGASGRYATLRYTILPFGDDMDSLDPPDSIDEQLPEDEQEKTDFSDVVITTKELNSSIEAPTAADSPDKMSKSNDD